MSRARGAEPGFTLLELLVVMVVLALTLVIAAPRFGRPPSEPAELARRLVDRLGAARAAAVDRARIEPVDPDAPLRGPPAGPRAAADRPGSLRFHPDGSASGAVVEVSGNGRRARVRLEPLTGRIVAVDG
jgi:prepilin-type N-terminal cleavage/methylation domain-containing protein